MPAQPKATARCPADILRRTFEDFIPASSPLERELQILVAVQECTSREVLPAAYRSMDRARAAGAHQRAAGSARSLTNGPYQRLRKYAVGSLSPCGTLRERPHDACAPRMEPMNQRLLQSPLPSRERRAVVRALRAGRFMGRAGETDTTEACAYGSLGMQLMLNDPFPRRRCAWLVALSSVLFIAHCASPLASARGEPGTPPIDELLDMAYTRRRFLRDSAAATGRARDRRLDLRLRQPRRADPPPEGVRIAIVGAGLAGLNTAYKLQKVGLRATVFEGSDRIGGRTFTAKDLLGPGLTTELGGEFIDSGHEEMLALMDEFGLQRLDTLAPRGRCPQEGDVLHQRAALHPGSGCARVRAAGEADSRGTTTPWVRWSTTRRRAAGAAFDRMSMSEYFDKIDAKGWMRELLEVAYVTEYGLEADRAIGAELHFPDRQPASWTIPRRSNCWARATSATRSAVATSASPMSWRAASSSRSSGVTAWKPSRARARDSRSRSRSDGGVVDEDADIVVLAIPFTLLREVDMRVDLPPLKKTAIQQLGYGTQRQGAGGVQARSRGRSRATAGPLTPTKRSSSRGTTASCNAPRPAG